MPNVIAIVLADLERSRLGLPSRLGDLLQDRSVLDHTIRRLACIDCLGAIVLVHPVGQDPLSVVTHECAKLLETCSGGQVGVDLYQFARTSARKWALASWRGGLGGATCFDELLPAAPLAAAMAEHDAEAALIVGGDWPLVDPQLCAKVIDRHLESPEVMQMTFTQAPPGLVGLVAGRKLIGELAEQVSATFGGIMSYQPSKPQADPIGRDLCVQIDPVIRNLRYRLIYDTPRSAALICHVANRLGDCLSQSSALTIARTVNTLDSDAVGLAVALPQQVTIELTPRRAPAIHGPIVPQHYLTLDRPEMDLALALRIVRQLGRDQDLSLTVGGLGDPLLHPDWEKVVSAACDAGVFGIAIETDLLGDDMTMQRLMDLPIDVVTVRLNADTAETYQRAMTQLGDERCFPIVIQNLEKLLNESNQRRHNGSVQQNHLPWVVPRLIKTRWTMDDMEGFFDRWTHFTGHAVIEGAATGRGPHVDLMPAQSPIPMASPQRSACRQIGQRMTILSNGQVAQCDQDWLGSRPVGNTHTQDLAEIWQQMQTLRRVHDTGRWDEMALCAGCQHWHRP